MTLLTEFFHSEWQRSDVWIVLALSVVMALWLGRLYPAEIEKDKQHPQYAAAYRWFYGLTFGITLFFALGLLNVENYWGFVVWIVLSTTVNTWLRALYRIFLYKETADWWMENHIDEFIEKQKGKDDNDTRGT